MIPSLSRPGETRGRARIVAAGLLALAAVWATGCDLFSSDFRECGAMCGSKGAASVTYVTVNGFKTPSCICRGAGDGGCQ